ncbi:MAG: TrmH family RNA methyltransferase [Planctomycetota bacterium]
MDTTKLFGAIAAEAALSAGTRDVVGLWADETLDHRKLEPLRRAAKVRRVELQRVERDELDRVAGHPGHGGVVAAVGPRTFLTLDELLIHSGGERGFYVVLDGVEDPFNFGQALRSLYAAGCHGVVLRPRNWLAPDTPAPEGRAPAAAVVARASAGTSEFLPLAITESIDDAAAFFAVRGHTVAATADDHPEAIDLHAADLTAPLLLVVGGEKRGVKRSLLARADVVLRVPYARRFDHALGTVAAVSVLGFEVARQRGMLSG